MANDHWSVGTGGDRGAFATAICFPLVATVLLGVNLAGAAADRGQGRAWGLLAPLSFVGMIVVYCLPDRTSRRGFPIEPDQS